MSTTSLRHLVRLYNPIQQATRKPLLPVFRHAGHILHSRPATVRARVSPSRTSFEKVRFTASDVPPLDFWTEHLKQSWFESSDEESPYKVSAAECLSACRRYAALAIQDKPGWRRQALTTSPTISSSGAYSSQGDDNKVSLHTLSYVVAMLIRSATAGHLATHIVHSGVMLGYPPSVLTMARLGLERDLLDRPQFLPAKEALQKLAALGPAPTSSSSSKSKSNKPGATKQPDRNSSSSSSSCGGDDDYYLPDALTVVGLIHARRNEPGCDKRAVRYLNEARAVATAAVAASTSTPSSTSTSTSTSTTTTPLAPPSGGPGIWQWRASAVLALVEVYLRRGQRDLARALLRKSVGELDNAEACYRYAQLLLPPPPPPEDGGEGEDGKDENYAERVALLERAAVSGVEGAAREMSRVELRRLEEEKGLSEREKRDRRFMVEEWLVIAGDKGVV